MMLTLIIVSLLTISQSGPLWLFDDELWRGQLQAELTTGSSDSYYETITSQTWTECRDACIGDDTDCLSFLWDGDDVDGTSGETCKLSSARFGFADRTLQFASSWNYYEKPIGGKDTSDSLGDALKQSLVDLHDVELDSYTSDPTDFNYQQFLLYFRTGQRGYVNSTYSGSKYEILQEIENVEDAEECSKYCVRNRGVMDAELGSKCVSFNYSPLSGDCHLLSFSFDGVDYPMTEFDGDTWYYYDRIIGEGCYVINGECPRLDNEDFVGIWSEDASTVVSIDNLQWEYKCMEKARHYHENVCDGNVNEATVAYWGTDGLGVANIWNSWDLSEGCVMDLTQYTCNNSARFGGKQFRDSIGEEEYAAAVDSTYCWARAKEYFDYCDLTNQFNDGGDKAQLNVTFPSENKFYIEPLIACECDKYGMKIETGFGMEREYCSRDLEYEYCYRTIQDDYFSGIDLLCSDSPCGRCPEYQGFDRTDGIPLLPDYSFNDLTSVDYLFYDSVKCDDTNDDNATCCNIWYDETGDISSDDWKLTNTQCFLFYPDAGSILQQAVTYTCSSGKFKQYSWDDDFTDYNGAHYFEIPVDDIPSDYNGGTADWSAYYCMMMAQEIHESCGNDLESFSEQIFVWYAPNGSIFAYPSFAAPYETTLIRGESPAAHYTEDPLIQTIDFMPIRNGRWQTFVPTETAECIQINIYFRNDYSCNLSIAIWEGDGITDSIFLTETSVIASPYALADYIEVPISNLALTSGTKYTWQITSVSSESLLNADAAGFIGYVRGNGYSEGIGDLAWDYLFIVWVELQLSTNAETAAVITIKDSERPWFEIWCGMLIGLFLIFLVFLCLLHWKRKYDEDQEKKEDREFQAKIREEAKKQSEKERRIKNGELIEDDSESEYEDDSEYEDYDEEEEEETDDGEYDDDDDDQKNNRLKPDPYDRVASGSGYIDEDNKKKKKNKSHK